MVIGPTGPQGPKAEAPRWARWDLELTPALFLLLFGLLALSFVTVVENSSGRLLILIRRFLEGFVQRGRRRRRQQVCLHVNLLGRFGLSVLFWLGGRGGWNGGRLSARQRLFEVVLLGRIQRGRRRRWQRGLAVRRLKGGGHRDQHPRRLQLLDGRTAASTLVSFKADISAAALPFCVCVFGQLMRSPHSTARLLTRGHNHKRAKHLRF